MQVIANPRKIAARIARVLTGIAVFVSLVASVVGAALWIRSYYAWDYLSYICPLSKSDRTRPGLVISIDSPKGQIRVHVAHWERVPKDIRVPRSPIGWYYRKTGPLPPPQPSEAVGNTQYVNSGGFFFQVGHPPPTPPAKRPGLSVVGVPNWRAHVPFWFIVAFFCIAPGLWLVSRLRRLRARLRANRNLCPACGYDLRAGHDKCPECGAPVTAKPAPPAATPDTI
jgi:hypothetical protein